MEKEKILEIKKENGVYSTLLNRIDKYKNICGVWVMYDESGTLLEVAQTSDIFSELDYDLSWLLKDYSGEDNTEKRYSARRLFEFSQKFDVLKCDKNRTTAKYRFISTTRDHIKIYIVLEEKAKSENKYDREEIEMEIAIDNQALFWNAFGRQRRLAKAYYKKKDMVV